MTTEYRILGAHEPVQKGDEFFMDAAWHEATNWQNKPPKQMCGTKYRRPLPASRLYFPKWLRPDAPGCPVHVLWAESPVGIATVAQVAADAKPGVLEPKLEPGTGYRLLGDDEIVQFGDEWYNPGPAGDWATVTGSVGNTAKDMGFTYRRKLPKYRPYTNAAEAAEGLQGKLIRHTVTTTHLSVSMVTQDKAAVGEGDVSFWGLLKYWKFTDGTPCGVLVTQEKGTK